jgi:hypothetical protein
MTKISLNDPKDFDIQKDIWKTYGITDVNDEFNRPLEYPCVIVYNYISVEERSLVNCEFVYSKDFFPIQN